MTTIRINRETLEIQIDGHAGGGPKGQDLICCAVSTLTETLSIYLEIMLQKGLLADLKEEIESGHVYLYPQPYGWSKEQTTTAIDVIRNGYIALAEQYSDKIRYEEE